MQRTITPFNFKAAPPKNKIDTSKYTWYSFLPKNLWEQFHALANVYFLGLAALQCYSEITITAGIPSILLPLSIVIFVGAARDLIEDLQRKASDQAENRNTILRMLDQHSTGTVRWEEVRPGYVLVVHKTERLPCDLLLLDSSDPGKSCYVETKGLDGEINLKQKVSPLPGNCQWECSENIRVDVEEPSERLYDFNGAIVRDGHATGIGVDNMLLRGSSLQQTDWIVGLAIYCGHDTRVMLNSKRPRFKQSQLDIQLNNCIIFIFIMLLLISSVGGAAHAIWDAYFSDGTWYLMLHVDRHPIDAFLKASGTWVLQLGNLVPISLLITATSVKFCQGQFIELDAACCDPRNHQHAAAQTSQVLESVGLVTHVFSDKTGTLTRNEMVYKACSLAGKVYGLDAEHAAPTDPQPSGSSPHVDFGGATQFLDDLVSADAAGAKLAASFLLCHALCHTVTVGGVAGGSSVSTEYVSSSPDELALVSAARELGLSFSGVRDHHVGLHVSERRLERALEATCGATSKASSSGTLSVQQLDVCEFDNDRKRSSVVVRYPNGTLVLFVKGADTSVLPYIGPESERARASRQLVEFAGRGLRTLCLGFRELSEEEYDKWHLRFQAALATVSGNRTEAVHRVSCEIEESNGLRLLGVTAIEDRLQDGVPEAIERLRLAGITIWMLTGDKMETAISIGRSCRLITDDMENIEISGLEAEIEQDLGEAMVVFGTEMRALTITGSALGIVLGNPALVRKFFHVGRHCRSVICCRVSPKQKGDVVELFKGHRTISGDVPVTLAIGDGANDVAMIVAAHVGVGLSGKEGAEAARAADFALAQFRFIVRLLFVHGRESYRRNRVLMCYMFYKNILLCLPAFLYGFSTFFSGQPFYSQMLHQIYNIVFTCLPIIAYCLFDRPVNDLAELETRPHEYALIRSSARSNWTICMLWLGAGNLQSALLAFCFFDHLDDQTSIDLWTLGLAIFLWVILGVSATLCRRLSAVFLPTVASFVGSGLSVLGAMSVLATRRRAHLWNAWPALFGTTSGWFWVATLLFLASHLLLGEPLIIWADALCGSAPARAIELPGASVDTGGAKTRLVRDYSSYAFSVAERVGSQTRAGRKSTSLRSIHFSGHHEPSIIELSRYYKRDDTPATN